MYELLITQCDDSRKWYADLIGQRVIYLGEDEREYESRQPEGYRNFISKTDAILVLVEPS